MNKKIPKEGVKELQEIMELSSGDRTFEEIITDHILLLYLIDKYDKISQKYQGITKIQKFSFLSQFSMQKAKYKAFDYNFLRHNHGPMSTQIYKDISILQSSGLLQKRDNLKLTQRGTKLINALSELYSNNSSITQLIDYELQKFTDRVTSEVKAYVYKVEIPTTHGKMAIKDIPKGFNILSKLHNEEANLHFRIDDTWKETISLYFDWDIIEKIKERIKLAQKVPSEPF